MIEKEVKKCSTIGWESLIPVWADLVMPTCVLRAGH